MALFETTIADRNITMDQGKTRLGQARGVWAMYCQPRLQHRLERALSLSSSMAVHSGWGWSALIVNDTGAQEPKEPWYLSPKALSPQEVELLGDKQEKQGKKAPQNTVTPPFAAERLLPREQSGSIQITIRYLCLRSLHALIYKGPRLPSSVHSLSVRPEKNHRPNLNPPFDLIFIGVVILVQDL
ncbi:hypothetical protein TESG_06163 [Trichophyton tonsurans CBS 112818]|uniref:Uncharacterized protein n=1 Tax=Trichophyton tonsurans (strain CBS 112818) TaxID=647933 RepID=F2S534_TRIT1|nr:hypothetical protein TESG_06163 [Trichophyton tonsurans CBS 112818]